jgi:hypothetical protein
MHRIIRSGHIRSNNSAETYQRLDFLLINELAFTFPLCSRGEFANCVKPLDRWETLLINSVFVFRQTTHLPSKFELQIF